MTTCPMNVWNHTSGCDCASKSTTGTQTAAFPTATDVDEWGATRPYPSTTGSTMGDLQDARDGYRDASVADNLANLLAKAKADGRSSHYVQAAVNHMNERDRDGRREVPLHETEPDYAEIRERYQRLLELAYPADDPDGKVDPTAFRSAFKPSAIVGNAHRIYDYMKSHNVGPDSATREAAFEYAAADTGRDYDEMYDAWMDEKPIASPCRDCGTVIEVRLADATGRCSDCVGAWIRETTKRSRR